MVTKSVCFCLGERLYTRKDIRVTFEPSFGLGSPTAALFVLVISPKMRDLIMLWLFVSRTREPKGWISSFSFVELSH